MTEKPTITIDLETAEVIARAFLPRNPNKLRLPHCTPEQRAQIRAACFTFTGHLINARGANVAFADKVPPWREEK